MLKWCPHCSKAFHPKRIVCTDCGATDLGWKQASGKGTVYSFSEVHHAPSEVFAKSVPYTVGLVALEEGVHLFSRLIPEAGAIAIGVPGAGRFPRARTRQAASGISDRCIMNRRSAA